MAGCGILFAEGICKVLVTVGFYELYFAILMSYWVSV